MGTRIGVFKILKMEEDRESDTGAVLGGGDKKVWITMVENEKKIEEDRESDTGAVLGGGDRKVWITMVENEKKKW